MMIDSMLLALLIRGAVRRSVISSSATSGIAYMLEAEHTVRPGNTIGHGMQDDSYYLAYYQFISGTESLPTVADVELDLFYKPPIYPAQVIFGRCEHVVPESMPENIGITVPDGTELSKSEILDIIQQRLNAAGRALLIDLPQGGAGYAKCRIWRLTPLWI